MHRMLKPLLAFCFAIALAFIGESVLQPTPTVHANALITGDSAANAKITVAHFAPFAATVDGTAVTIRVNGSDVITDFVYGEIQTGIELPGGTYTIEVVPDGTSTVALSGTVTISDDLAYSLAAIGGANGWPLALRALVDDRAPPAAGTAKVRISHFAPFANTADGTKVDICNKNGVVGALTNIPYDATTPYLPLPVGDYDLKIAVAGTNCATVALDLPSFYLGEGDIVELYATGLNTTAFPLMVSATPALTLSPRLSVAHFAPFASAAISTSVTVRVDGTNVYTNFVFSEVKPYVQLPTGQHLVEILPTGTNTVALSGTFTLTAGTDYTVAAIGGANSWPLALRALIDDNSTPAAGTAHVRISHFAPFAATADATKVDICDKNGLFGGLTNIPYDATTPYLPLPVGDYDLKIAVAGTNCATVALDLPSIYLGDGDIVELYATGLNTAAYPLNVISTPALKLSPRVAVAHFAPFASAVISTSVTVRVDGTNVYTNFVFSEVKPYVQLPTGQHLVEILPTGTNTVALSGTFTLTADTDYTVAAIGDGAKQALELLPLVDNNSAPTTGKARLRVAHLASFANTPALTAVDICLKGGPALVSNFKYKDVSTLEIDPGFYNLVVAVAGTNCQTVAVSLPTVAVPAGGVAYIYAIGDAVPPLAPGNLPVTVITLPDLQAKQLYMPIIDR